MQVILDDDKPLEYDKWVELYDEELSIKWAESGRDREMCFEAEAELEREYEEYLIMAKDAIEIKK